VVQVRRLSPDELSPFLDFMDGPAFKGQPQWAGCYCQFYLNTPEQNADPAAKTGLNRELTCDRVNAGTMQGYLAFETVDGVERVIGWMAANESKNFLALPGAEPTLARILCFVVDEGFQRRGVARALLNFAIADLPTRGFTAVEAAPYTQPSQQAANYRGHMAMYEAAGFEPIADLGENGTLVRRSL
jgi:ribosomal protein S18 acetylase RimI-like enzyme